MSTIPFIPTPALPKFLYTNDTSPRELVQICTSLLEQAPDLIAGLDKAKEISKALKSGTPGARKWALRTVHAAQMSVYLEQLETARQWALDSGFAEVMVDSAALRLDLTKRTSFGERKALVDVIWAVRRMVQDIESAEREQQRQSGARKGRSPQKAAKAARDREIRGRMKQPKGQKPQAGRAA